VIIDFKLDIYQNIFTFKNIFTKVNHSNTPRICKLTKLDSITTFIEISVSKGLAKSEEFYCKMGLDVYL